MRNISSAVSLIKFALRRLHYILTLESKPASARTAASLFDLIAAVCADTNRSGFSSRMTAFQGVAQPAPIFKSISRQQVLAAPNIYGSVWPNSVPDTAFAPNAMYLLLIEKVSSKPTLRCVRMARCEKHPKAETERESTRRCRHTSF